MTVAGDRASALLAMYAPWLDIPVIEAYGIVEDADGKRCCGCGDPECENPGKHPCGNRWNSGKSRKSSLQSVAQGVRLRGANVGLLMGGPLLLITIDIDGPEGEAVVRALETKLGALPATLTAQTGREGGGQHMVYRRRARPDLPAIKNSAGLYGVGLDIRSEGGMIIVSPSVHVTGNVYRWLQPPRLAAVAELPEAWDEFLAAGKGAKKLGKPVRRSASSANVSGLGRLAEAVADADDGTRNDTLNARAFVAGGAVAAGILPLGQVRDELVQAALAAGLDEQETIDTFRSGLGAGLEKAAPPRWGVETLTQMANAGRLPPFPVGALPKVLRDFVEALAVAHEVRPDLPGALVLAALACACMGKVRVQVRPDWDQPVNLYVLVGVESGEGKSPVVRKIMRPFHAIEDAQAGAQLIMKDATPEALAIELSRHEERMGIFDDEASAIAHILGRYQQRGAPPNIDLYLNAYDGDRFTVARVARAKLLLRAPLLTIGVAVQPIVLQHFRSGRDLDGRGLLNRFLFALPASLLGERTHDKAAVPEALQLTYDAAVASFCTWLPPAGARVTLSEEAREMHIRFLQEQEPTLRVGGYNHAIAKWCAKLPGTIPRIAALLHLAEHAGFPAGALQVPVGVGTMGRAIEIARYYREHARAVLAGSISLPFEREILGWAIRGGREVFTAREVKQLCSAVKNSGLPADPILKALVAGGVLVARAGGFAIAGDAPPSEASDPMVSMSASSSAPGGPDDAQ